MAMNVERIDKRTSVIPPIFEFSTKATIEK